MNGRTNVCGKPEEEKTVTAGTSAKEVTPSSGKVMKKVTVNPTPSQTKEVTAGTGDTTVSSDSGKLLSGVTVHPTPSQTKTVRAGTSNKTVSPDSGYLLSGVTVKPTPSQTKTVRDTNKVITVSPDSGKLLKKVIFEPEKIETTVKNLFNDELNTYRYTSGTTVGNASYGTTPANPDGSTMNKHMYDSTGSLGEVYRSPYLKPYLTNGHTYYFACWLYQTTPHGSFDFYWPISEPAVLTGVTVDVASQWVKRSTVFTRSGYTSGNQAARCDFNNPGNYGMNWNGLILVDLTAAFGAGYEPDVAWCDANIKYTTNDEEQAVTYYLP